MNDIKSNITLAYVKVHKPELADKCNAAKIKFEDGKFIVPLPMALIT